MFEELVMLFTTQPIGMMGALIAGIGLVSLAASSLSYRFRAFTNKKAWDGKTLPFLKVGFVLVIIGGALFAFQILVLNK